LPRRRITPKDVKSKRKTRSEAARMEGRRRGRVTFSHTRSESAPRVRAALVKFGVEVGERRADNADDDGGVVKEVGEEDGDERMKGEKKEEEMKERIGGLENCVE
jgi:hypothetical protein